MARLRACGALAFALLALSSHAAGALGSAGLRAQHAAIAPQLSGNEFGGGLVLQSAEAARRVDGDVYAVVEHPFATVSAALSDPAQWCEILILHLNTKYCRNAHEQGTTRIEMRIGKKHPQPLHTASLVAFAWRGPQSRGDYLSVQMDAAEGPYDTRDYRILVEAVPLEGGRTFLHFGYSLAYGSASHVVLRLYLGTIGRDKVGFTRTGDGLVEGMRGVVERNTMRYYLAIDAYLDSLAAPPSQQLQQRLRAWFDATERFPRQLHEIERDAYLHMKHDEVRRQSSAR